MDIYRGRRMHWVGWTHSFSTLPYTSILPPTRNTWRLSLWWHERRRQQMKSRRITNSVLVTTTVVVARVWICEGWSGKGFQSPPTLRLVLPRPHSTHSAAINLNIPFLSNIYGSILFHTRIKSGPLQITITHKQGSGSGMVEGKKKERVLCTLFYPFWCASELFGYINDDDDTQQWMWFLIAMHRERYCVGGDRVAWL